MDAATGTDAPCLSELSDGIFRVTQPLPWALDHVHCYALPGKDGWTIVDAGLGTPGTLERWHAALSELRGRVTRILVTHFHPDHLGAAAALVAELQPAEVVQGGLDVRNAEAAWGRTADHRAFAAHLATHGFPDDLAAASVSEEVRLPVETLAPTRLVGDGDVIEAGETYEVLHLPGHADGHIALLGRRTGRLIGGDVILEGITPNIGRWHDTAQDPLGRYFQTLERLRRLAPAVAYPGHGPIVEDVAGRAAAIRLHHDERLETTLQALRDGAQTTYEVTRRIWPGDLGLHEKRFALVEGLSHLEHLALRSKVLETEPGRWRLA